MSSLTIGAFIGISGIIIMLTGIPIAFALGLISVASIILFLDPVQFDMLGDFIFGSINDFTLLAIPLFVFMGALFANSKASKDLFEAAQKWTSRIPGGLAISSIVACAIFAALSGSSPATAAAIGKTGIPEMQRRGYSNAIATGAIVAGGTLGILIPPSVVLILYGVAVEQSIGRLFLAGVIPGIVLTLLFCLWVMIAVRLERKGLSVSSPEGATYITTYPWKERIASLLNVIPFLLLITGILYTLYAGIATPSEAAAVGAVLSFLMIILFYRSMTWKKLVHMLLETTKESTMILLITAFSALIGTVLSFLSVPQDLASFIIGMNLSKWLVLILINIFLLVLGFFIPPAAIILMTAPIIYPIIVGLGFDPIWFGIIMTLNMEAGLITPPVGLNLFVVKGIAPDIPTSDIIKGSLPFVGVIFIAIALFTVFPEIVTWLPNLLFS
ncbi:TRAP transporter large permease [Bacillus sp. FJAT-27251]|uniref:TRAP transporter large permease n=1 Tax=Bacillus sp. FJAT-27251 TaxID=1684142 RepID=UPI0006A76E99|nr:TRAP transporter large permease [Bacillus sp. FJAT-27251]